MRDLVWLVIVLLIIGWLIGYFIFQVESFIHILFFIAVILIIYKLVTGKKL